jgi:uncharacterized protein YukE
MSFGFEQWSAAAACESDQNPIVGDPARIAALATQLNTTADSLKQQADRLRSVDTEGFWKGDAATEFMKIKEKLPPLLDKVVTRYSAVGQALAAYHPSLQQAQDDAKRALVAYREAKGQARTAQVNVTQYAQLQQQAQLRQRPFQWTGADPHAQAQGASGALQAAVRQMSAAIEDRDGAASTCSKKIDDAIHDDLKNETGFWHALKKIGGAILDAFEKLAPILRTIATVLGVAAALLCWVPVLGEVLAGAALVVSAVTLAMDLTLKAAGRDVGWGDIALDALGCIPLGRATRLAKGASPMKWGQVAKGVLKGDKAQLGKLVGYGRSVLSSVGPAYKEILGAGERLATRAPAALADMGTGLAAPFTSAAGQVTLGSAVTGLRTVAMKEIGPVGLGLTAHKVYGLFTGDGGASTSASAPLNPATMSTGLPVTSSNPIRTVVAQPVALPAAA